MFVVDSSKILTFNSDENFALSILFLREVSLFRFALTIQNFNGI